jgi:hypothetical protein
VKTRSSPAARAALGAHAPAPAPPQRMHCSAAPSLRRAPQDYENRKNALIRLERDMLRAFGFIVHVEHPHKLVLNHLHVMGATALHQEAWSLANDR